MTLDFTSFLMSPQTRSAQELLSHAKNLGIQIEVIVITGGPCGGKTTALARLEIEFKERGWFIVVLPEAATLVRGAGFKAETGVISNYHAQMMMISQNEFSFVQAVTHAIQTGQRRILIIRDRCSLDGAAYMPSFTEYSDLVRDMGLNIRDLTTATAIIHLVSLAVDQPELYNQLKHSNAVRFETLEQARAADKKTLEAYEHFCLKVHKVANHTTSFDDKVAVVIRHMLEAIGEPKVESEAAYILKGGIDYWKQKLILPGPIKILQFYSLSGARYRKEEFPTGDTAYTVTTKLPTDIPTSRLEETVRIHSGQFYAVKSGLGFDSSRKPLYKKRFVFFFQDEQGLTHRGELDAFPEGDIGNAVRLEVEFTSKAPGLPAFLQGEMYLDVSGDDRYSNASIAKGTCPKPFG